MKLTFAVQMKIQKSISTVFDAVYNPDKLSAYFTTGGASAPMREGAEVEWLFADNPEEPPIGFPISVLKTIPNKMILFRWEGAKGRYTEVEMNFEKTEPEETRVEISETGWRDDQSDLERSYLNCQGWTQMLCSLKAYVEYGINIREGAYRGLYKSEESDRV